LVITIDTSKKVDKNLRFIAELIILSAKNDCTIDESINKCKEILREN
jgi:hypothetical protein